MRPAALKRGGAHNRRDRTSWQLKERDCRKMIDAGFAAWDAGQPLSRFITLAWGKAGIDASDAVRATGAFINRARDWMRWHGYPMPWEWVQESGVTFGQHAHILLYVPAELDLLFRPMPRRWVKAIIAARYVKGTLQSQRLGSAYSCTINPERYEAVLLGKLHYMLKCAPAALEDVLDMRDYRRKPWGQASRVIGKRAAVWQGDRNRKAILPE